MCASLKKAIADTSVGFIVKYVLRSVCSDLVDFHSHVSICFVLHFTEAQNMFVDKLLGVVILAGFCLATAHGQTLNITETTDFTSANCPGAYPNIGTLALGTNTVSGSVGGSPAGSLCSGTGDLDDSYSLTVPAGLTISQMQLTITNFNAPGGNCQGVLPGRERFFRHWRVWWKWGLYFYTSKRLLSRNNRSYARS